MLKCKQTGLFPCLFLSLIMLVTWFRSLRGNTILFPVLRLLIMVRSSMFLFGTRRFIGTRMVTSVRRYLLVVGLEVKKIHEDCQQPFLFLYEIYGENLEEPVPSIPIIIQHVQRCNKQTFIFSRASLSPALLASSAAVRN